MAEDLSSSRPLPELVGGRYRIVSRLGVGGMGVVYKAIDTQLNRAVAVKALEDRRFLVAGASARLRTEALAAASLDHPYVCKVYELVETPTDTYIVMEFIEGETLASMLKRGPLTLPQTLQLGREIAEGLANAHARGLVHRDVKPSNVMVTPHGHVKLLDFGVAGADMASTPGDQTRTNAPQMTLHAGTPQYMAPEQAAGHPITARADLFSFGVLLYECLTSQLPFSGTTTFDYVRNVMQSAPRRLDRVAPDTPADLVDLIERCLEKSPIDRPESADVVVQQLGRLSDSLTGTGGRVLTVGQHRARRRFSMIAGGVAVVAIAALGWWFWPAGAAVNAPPRQSRPFLTSSALERGSRISPDAQWVAFLSIEGGATRVMVQQIDGGEPRPLTLERGTPEGVLWSPDGRQVVVAMSLEQSRVLQIYPAFFGGSAIRTIPLPDKVDRARLLRWIGTDMYLEAQESGVVGVALVRVGLTDPATIDVVSASWTIRESVRALDVHPNGREVVLRRIVEGQEDIWIAGLDGSSLRAVTQDALLERTPIWSGSGDRLIIQSNRGGQMDLWEIDPATGSGMQLTSGEVDTIAESTSADGSIISFNRLTQDATLWQWNASSGQERQLTQDALSDYSPVVSADGHTIAFQRSQPTPSRGYIILDAKLMVARVTAAGPLSDVRAIGDGFAASLAADGSWVAFLELGARPAHGPLRVRDLTRGTMHVASQSVQMPGLSNRPVDWLGPIATWVNDELWFLDHTGLPSVRRYRPGQAEPAAIVTQADTENAYLRDMYRSQDGRMVAYLAGHPGGNDLVVIDTRSGKPRSVAKLQGGSTSVLLRGWLDGSPVAVRRTKLNDDFSSEFEVLAIDPGSGATRQLTTVQNGFVATARLDPERRSLLVTRVEQGAHNLYEVPFATGIARAITRNGMPGVTYSGFNAAAGVIIGVREERREDIWLIQATGSRTGNSAGR